MYNLVPLASHHDKQGFDCGNEALNRFLHQFANQHMKKGLSKTYVLTTHEQPNDILGFYTLSAFSLRDVEIKGLPNRFDIPCLLLGRLAIAESMQGKGISQYLIAHTFAIIVQTTKLVGISLVIVDVKNEGLVRFYERLGFSRLDGLRMYRSTKDL